MGRDANAKNRAKNDAEFLESFKAAYNFMSPSASQSKENEGYASFTALYERNKKLTATAWSLIEHVQHISQRAKNLDTNKITQNNWKQEDKAQAKLFKARKEASMEKAHTAVTFSGLQGTSGSHIS